MPSFPRRSVRSCAGSPRWRCGAKSEDAKAGDGHEIDIDRYQRTANSLRRMCETIGLERVAKDITPDIREQLIAEARQRRVADAADAQSEDV